MRELTPGIGVLSPVRDGVNIVEVAGYPTDGGCAAATWWPLPRESTVLTFMMRLWLSANGPYRSTDTHGRGAASTGRNRSHPRGRHQYHSLLRNRLATGRPNTNWLPLDMRQGASRKFTCSLHST